MGKAIILVLAINLVLLSSIPTMECRPQQLDDAAAAAPVSSGNPAPAPAPEVPSYRPQLFPYDLHKTERVTGGVDTIINGVGTGRLSEVLRGSFMFTPRERVRTIANGVIDSVFGKRDEAGSQAEAPLAGF